VANAPAKPRFFKTPADFRVWLEKYGATTKELWIGYYKKSAPKKSMVYKEALDQALCFGWIDGIVKSIDAFSYMQRWTPRLATSNWSLVNTIRINELIEQGLVAEPGLKAFRERNLKKSGVYLYERKPVPLSPEYERRFKGNKRAWTFFQALPPGYKRLMVLRVMSAVKPETREKHLAQLIEICAAEKRMELM
jgi:uncharacterized protein YdeI (YjbR/CyaY-like superfamily)